jgi:hypothetical protein
MRDRPASDDPPPQPAPRSRHSAQRCACPTREEEERLRGEGGSVAASGRLISGAPVSPGELTEIGVAVFRLPEVEAPRRLTLSFHARIGQRETSNRWPLWVFPERPWAALSGVHLLDPGQQLAGLVRLAPGLVPDLAGARVAVATAWTPELAAFVEAGGRAVLVHSGGGMAGPLPTVEVPWWREAVKLIEPHPAWGDFPHDGWAGLQFYSLAPDRALDASGLPAGWRPMLRRVDARTTALHEYALEMNYGAGRLIVSTLRFMGGLGDQAVGIERNPAAPHLLASFARHLSSEEA